MFLKCESRQEKSNIAITHKTKGTNMSNAKKHSNLPKSKETVKMFQKDDETGGVVEMEVGNLDVRQLIINKNRGFKHSSHQIKPEKTKPELNCDTCGYKFYGSYNLQNHLDTVHIKDGDWTVDIQSM